MLESIHVTKRYGGKAANDDLTFSILPGHIYGLLGPNGSGKSTWMKTAAGLIVPDGGEITLDGTRVGKKTKAHTVYMATEDFFYNYMRIRDVERYYRDFFEDFDTDRFHRLLDELEFDGNMKVTTLSSGMMAKLKIAVTMSRNARVYMLDEPFNGIDLIARDAVVKMIIENLTDDCAIIISSHLIEELEKIVDTCVFLKNGRLILQGEIEEIRSEQGCSLIELYKKLYA